MDSTTATSSLQLGVQLHQSGQFDRAAELYRQALAVEPRNADAHHLMGLIALEKGQYGEAVARFREAVECAPAVSQFHHHLGAAYLATGASEAAVASIEAALSLAPPSAPLLNDLGNALRSTGKLPEAEDAYRRAVRLDAGMAEAHNNLGTALLEQQRFEEALGAYRQALHLLPRVAEVHFNLGNCYRALGQLADAIAAYQEALALGGNFPQAVLNLASTHHAQGAARQALRNFDRAAESFRAALALNPRSVESHNGLGVALQSQGELDAARDCYRQALRIQPDDPTAHYNLGTVFQAEAEHSTAIEHFQKVLAIQGEHADSLSALAGISLLRGERAAAGEYLDRLALVRPGDVEARYYRGTMLLTEGNLLAGWKEFDYRSQCPFTVKRNFNQPRWDGSPLKSLSENRLGEGDSPILLPGHRKIGTVPAGSRIGSKGNSTLLLYSEYGFGDTLQFIRYAPMAQDRAAGPVVIEVPGALIPLLSESGFTNLKVQGEPLGHFDLQLPLMSLPGVFETSMETIPRDVPYIFPNAERGERWKPRLQELSGFKVGIHWQGNQHYTGDKHRSIPLAAFTSLAHMPGVTLISLQKGTGQQQIQELAQPFPLVVFEDLDAEGGAFMDTAALMAQLDLIITSDSAVAHLAGAMGLKVWLALAAAAEWRWFLDREDSPWYPTMRLFRQTELDNWPELFDRIAAALTGEAARGQGEDNPSGAAGE